MESFARHFRVMREARRMTQQQLAAAAGVALSTVSAVERLGSCDWRRPTALEIYRALAKRQALTAEERQQFSEGTGITDLPFDAADAHHAMYPLGEEFGDLGPAERKQRMALVGQLDKLVSRFGPQTTRVALDLVLQLVDLGTSDAVRVWQASPPPKTTTLLTHISPPKRIEDREVTIYTPANPAPAKPTRRRRAGPA